MPAHNVTLEGQLERVTFRNPDNHYTVARLKTAGGGATVTVVGHMAEAGIGQTLRLTGAWADHPRFGHQFKLETCEVILPDTVEGIRRYLSSGIIPGVGRRTVQRIVTHFGDQSLHIIENEPDRLKEVPGLGEKSVVRIADGWQAHHVGRALMQALNACGIPAQYGARLLQIYGDDAVLVLTREPYRLAADIPRDGFYLADRIALSQGLKPDHPGRIDACIRHVLEDAAGEGHTFVHGSEMTRILAEKFEVPPESAAERLSVISSEGEVVLEQGQDEGGEIRVFLKTLYSAEVAITRKLLALSSIPSRLCDIRAEAMGERVGKSLAFSLSEEQQRVFEGVLRQPVCVVTGGPGTGKTTLIRYVSAACGAEGKRILLAAPTGRAAKRLSEVTGVPAATVHRMLGYNPKEDRFEKNADEPLDADGVIVDEASMLDTLVMHHLVAAVSPGTHLMLVGDVFQLPSVGPGNVLGDLIASEKIATFELTRIFRQAAESPIVVNAHRVRRGEMPEVTRTSGALSEFYFIERSDEAAVVETVTALCTEKIPKAFGLDPMRDIQVLTPMHKGLAGTLHLNQVLQGVLNGAGKEGDEGPSAFGRFRAGDKVMHLKNNYEKEVFNGDIGTVRSVEPSRRRLTVSFEGRPVSYDFAELEELSLAYAISVHKSQGSEYPAVVTALVMGHYPLLQRNLLYTAMTRGKRLVVLVGSRRALVRALENDRPGLRRTGLCGRLRRGWAGVTAGA